MVAFSVLLPVRLIDYGLRDYGTAKWEGGDPECEHIEPHGTTLGKKSDTFHGSNTQEAHEIQYKRVCGKCGAIRIDQQIGLEVTPDAYIANLVEVFRECKRILRDDGTLWVNIGDSYASNGDRAGMKLGAHPKGCQCSYCTMSTTGLPTRVPDGMKPKDLIGIPWMLAFALRADGWYLRQDIIWHKPNPMPESVKDRCTKSHEYIFLLSKSAKYYYDSDAIREPLAASTQNDPRMQDMGRTYNGKGRGAYGETGKANGSMEAWTLNPNGRNKRDVWTVTTKPYKGAHYATFPPDLIKPMILAGCPKGGIVLDPFVGSGTTVATAIKLGRKGIGIDLNIKYLTENARQRIAEAQMQPRLI